MRTFSLFVITLLIAPLVHAQVPPPEPKSPLRVMRENAETAKTMIEKREIKRDAMQDIKQDIQVDRAEVIETKKEGKQDAIRVKQKMQETNAGIRVDRQAFTKETFEERRAQQQDFVKRVRAADTPEERRALIESGKAERDAFRDRIKTDVETMKLDFKGRREVAREEIREVAGEHARNVLRRLVHALENFETLLERLDTRITAMQEDGADTTSAATASASAGAAIDAAASAVATAQAAIEAAAASETPRDEMGAVRDAVGNAVEAVKAAHAALRAALSALKAIPPLASADTTEPDDDAHTDNEQADAE